MNIKRSLSLAAAVLTTTIAISAQETPRWLRRSAISPDGSKVVFCYQGDIFTVSSDGGRALQITTNEAYDSDPIWTPNGKKIVFSSYRAGSKDIFITSAEGGAPKRLTDYPGNETPLCVLDGNRVLFQANIQQDALYGGYPGTPQIWQVDENAGRPRLVTSLPIMALSVNKSGDLIYEDYKGYEDPLRKHHRSSVTRDIWLYKAADAQGERFRVTGDGAFTKLTPFAGEDRNPVFAADGKTFYYISEADGTLNVYKSSTDTPEKATQLTKFKDNPVRFLSVADNGTLCFSWNGDLYTMAEGKDPEMLRITVARDATENDVEYLTFSSGASSMAVSPDGKEIAVVIRGDVFVTSADYKTTKRITNTPEQERDVSFSKDGRELYYSAERNGHWGIYKTSLTDKREKRFTYATKFKEELVTAENETCFQPVVSPDGEWLAFLRDRTELVIKSTKDGKEKSLLKDVNYSYSDGDQEFAWSPDSKHLLCNYQINGGWNNSDGALIDIETGEITNLTQSGYSDGNFKWALKGKAMVWQSDKDGYRSHGSWGAENDIYIMFFDGKEMTRFYRDKEDAEIAKAIEDGDKSEKKLEKEEKKEKKDSVKQAEKPEKLILDLENREFRTSRLTRLSGRLGDFYLTQDGTKLFYTKLLEKSYDLCEMDIKKGDVKVLKKGVRGSLIPSADDKFLYIFTGSSITKVTVASGAMSVIAFSGDYEFKPKAERNYIFEHVWKQVNEKFYDPQIHGIDWAGYRKNYEQFMPYIANNFDFQDLLSEMLGELNGSHTGARASYRSRLTMGWLGAIYDPDYEGDGLRIAEILPSGPLNLADSGIKAGDIIESIDGERIKAGESWFGLLRNKTGKKVCVVVRQDKKEVELFVEPTYSESKLMYLRWVKQREDMTDRLSGGKVGYSHVQGMDSPSFRTVYSKLLGKYRAADAAVVDTRHNGGGWLHDDLATFLSGKEYVRYTPRGQYIGSDPYNKWRKPSCVLMCEDNYSDASGFPYTYRTLGIGKLIGMPVPGTMTAVWWETQLNGMVFGIPQVGSLGTKEGRWLENMQIEPDIKVDNDPASVLRGEDKQLEAAVEEMLKTK